MKKQKRCCLFILHFSAAKATKQSWFCFAIAAPCWVDTRWHLFRNPCSRTWKAFAHFWNREINKCTCDCLKKKEYTHTRAHIRWCECVCARVWRSIIVCTICCMLSSHSHLFIRRESTNIIWIPIRLNLRVHTLHHHEASTVHCNLNPLFESCACVRREDGGREGD